MTLGPIQFDAPVFLVVGGALWALAWLLARKSMSGLGRRTRVLALALRFVVIALLCGALAEPNLRRESEDVASIVVLDVSRSVPGEQRAAAQQYIAEALEGARAGKRLGLISAAEEALVQSLASELVREVRVGHVGGDEGSDIGAGIRLALAVAPEDAASRVLLVSDGNETAGSLLRAAENARVAGVPIDVYPIAYDFESEVVFDRLIAPSSARRGETVSLRFVMEATRAVSGRISLLVDGQPVDLDANSSAFSAPVTLDAGTNVRSVPVTIPGVGAQRFEAFFEPDDPASDAIGENNRARAVTFVASEGRVLVYTQDQAASGPLISAMRAADVEIIVRDPAEAHESLEELTSYDGVVLVDVPADRFSFRQQDELRAYVHDLGGGLLVVGGENSYGAGGWIGSPLADALPVKLDPPQKRELPRGALALIMHSCEAPRGNYWGQQTALAAASAMTRADLVGVLEYSWELGGVGWVHPLEPIGDGTKVRQAINSLTFGDMPDFNAAMTLALRDLKAANAGQKHAIIISDGDPSGPGPTLIQGFADAGISISTVAVFPHGGGANSPDVQKMQAIAQATGGQAYYIGQGTQLGLSDLPQIFIREAKTIQRSLIWEGDPFEPARMGVGAETMRGFGSVPPISGYIVTADREGLSQVTLRGMEDDPILAQWQHGLGRVVTFMSDAATKWSAPWVSWPGYGAFWQQHLRWAMRPSGSANVRVTTQDEGDRTRVIVDALDAEGERLNFARFQGRVVQPGLTSASLDLRQTGPGRYEGVFESGDAGSYVVNLRYESASAGGGLERGAVQASVIRSEGDERRALRDNRALLQQVAELTGGRVLLDPDPAQADLFARAGLREPVSLRPIWLLIAALATGLFLADVAIRRVRIDIPAMVRAIRRALSRRSAASEEQIGALRAARERSRQEMAERAERASTEEAQPAKATASVKFEAEAGSGAAPVVDAPEARKTGPAIPKAKETRQDGAEDEEEGISRLMRAKKRAQRDMGEETGDDAR
ncbi:MAG: glutamine amidotransferase [Phycisphaerales bacterium]